MPPSDRMGTSPQRRLEWSYRIATAAEYMSLMRPQQARKLPRSDWRESPNLCSPAGLASNGMMAPVMRCGRSLTRKQPQAASLRHWRLPPAAPCVGASGTTRSSGSAGEPLRLGPNAHTAEQQSFAAKGVGEVWSPRNWRTRQRTHAHIRQLGWTSRQCRRRCCGHRVLSWSRSRERRRLRHFCCACEVLDSGSSPATAVLAYRARVVHIRNWSR